MTYQEALDYLYSFIDYSLTRSFRYSPEKFDLERMRALLRLLGNPQLQYRCIHVAGTKGKGSVSALMAGALSEAGYRTGLYTSPHLQDYCERIQVDHQPISREQFVNLVNEIQPCVNQIPQLTTFELTTALGLMYFAEQKVDVAVVEVGLGGRLDATNVIDPLLSVITSISYDHMAVLGNTLEQIAAEKGGIIKPGKPVVVSPQKGGVVNVFQTLSKEKNAPLYQVGKDFLFEPLTQSLDNQTFSVWKAGDLEHLELNIPLLGKHQVENGATAFTALQLAGEVGLKVPNTAITKGFSQVFWPGRFEILQRQPWVMVVDSAHNRDSALRLRETLEDYLPGRSISLIFGASEDKDISGMFAELSPRIDRVIATQSTHPRAMNPQQIIEVASQNHLLVEKTDTVETALKYAMDTAEPNSVILVTGSLFVVAAVRETWQKSGHPLRTY